MAEAHLLEPVLDGGIRSTNFFNGRLLSAEDLSTEQTADRERQALLGRAVGEGVAYGLEVEAASAASPAVSVSPGLAISRAGRMLALRDPVTVSLTKPASPASDGAARTTFGDCEPGHETASLNGHAAEGAVAYLLVMGPASGGAGRAPVSGLGNVAPGCNTRYNVDGVRFRLLEIGLTRGDPDLASPKRLRNRVAYECFGVGDIRAFEADPWDADGRGYGLVDNRLRQDRLRPDGLADCEAPLATLRWTSSGIEWVDMWSVRRRITHRASDGRWAPLWGDRCTGEAEAISLQFECQLRDILLDRSRDPRDVAAPEYFRYLPPAGLLPVARQGYGFGFDPDKFLGVHAPETVEPIEGSLLRGLLQEALYHDPIDLSVPQTVRLYSIRENEDAIAQGRASQLTLVFASRTLSSRGGDRFGSARWGSSRFAQPVV
jgi:hypothetical protein